MADERDPSTIDIAALGLSAAASVVERMLEVGRSAASAWQLPVPANGEPLPMALPSVALDPPSSDPAERARQMRQVRMDVERVLETYAEWTRTFLDQAATLVEQAGPDGAASSPAGSVLVLGPTAAGSTATGVAHVHVLDGPPAPPAPLHATPLVSHDGSVVPGDSIRCTPGELDTRALRTSAPVEVTAAVPPDVPPGTYHGHLLATGLPEVVLALRLEVMV